MEQVWNEPKVYAVKHGDERIRMASRSGGIFTALTDRILEDGGVVYGCVLDPDFKARHIRAEDRAARDRMRGSKYIQSRLGDTFKQVRKDLEEGRNVLFSGTSCQVAGLKNYLGEAGAENLLCVDIVCHGVPSEMVWDKYLAWQEEKTGRRVSEVDFRDKIHFDWHTHYETLTMDDGSLVSSEVFKNLFYGHHILRPCCYACPYKSILHPGDITIGDYWGIEQAAPGFEDGKGVSLVLINNSKGEALFDRVRDGCIWKETRIEDSMQPPLKAPFPRPEGREVFWQELETKDFGYIAKKYGGNNFAVKARNLLEPQIIRLKGIVKKVLRYEK